jgi:Ca-activated chloride channel family protein
MGGTDFRKALQLAFDSAARLRNPDRYLVLITDGNPTLTRIQSRDLIEQFREGNRTAGMRAFCFGIGSDTNGTLLAEFAGSSNGLFEWAGENEDLDFKLESFFAKIGQYPATNLVLQSSQNGLLHSVYPSEPSRIYLGSAHDWFGRYRAPAAGVTLSVSGAQEGVPLALQRTVDFPESAVEHDFIPRGWARMRVDFLLRKMELEGEDQASIDEIIALSKKYKFVTPYTSFLAAPRSLLRPRLIRPGDPLLRVKTDPDIVSIVAIFPFGLVKPLQYLESEDTWQTRFLVPVEMADGTYYCRLVLRDRAGNQYHEKKSFVVDSRPPVFQTRWDGSFARGRAVKILVSADADTRYLFARLENLPPVRIQWSGADKASVGYIEVPADFKRGVYKFEVVGEDFAHNQSRWAQQVEVL